MKKGFYGGNSAKDISIDGVTKCNSEAGQTARVKPDWIKKTNDYFNFDNSSKLNLTMVNPKTERKRKR